MVLVIFPCNADKLAASISSGETLGLINFADSAGNDYAIIKGRTGAAGGSNDYPGELVFGTAADGASATTDHMIIDRSGRMGLGTNSPGHNLEIKGSFPDFAISDSDTANDKFRILHNGGGTQLHVDPNNVGPNASYFLVSIDNTERMRIDSSGRLGLGTVSATQLLEMHGDTPVLQMRDTSSYVADTGPEIRFQGLDSDGLNKNFASILGISHAQNDGQLIFKTRTGGSQYERVRIDELGRMGIGTQAPNRKLQVAGATAITNSGDTGAFLFDPAGSVNTLLSRAGQSSTTALPLVVKMGNTEAMRIQTDGDIHLGSATDYAWIRPYESSTGNLIISSNQGATGGANDSAVILRTRGTERFRVTITAGYL